MSSSHLGPTSTQFPITETRVNSFRIGWGSLIIGTSPPSSPPQKKRKRKKKLTPILAGGGAYYYAKREIDASRREKFRKLQAQQQLNANLEFDSSARGYSNDKNYLRNGDLAGSPSAEASSALAPTTHETDTHVGEKSAYEAAVPYRSRKGDRFS